MNDFLWAVVIVAVLFLMVWLGIKAENSHWGVDKLIEACEQELPRNQKRILKAVPETPE